MLVKTGDISQVRCGGAAHTAASKAMVDEVLPECAVGMNPNDAEEKSSLSAERLSGGKCFLKARYVMAIMGFLSMCFLQIMRTSINVAVVAMVNFTDDSEKNVSTDCPGPEEIGTSPAANGGFAWSKTQVGALLASYYYGYPVTSLVGGYLANRFGPRLVVGLSMLLASILTCLCPVAARLGFVPLLVTRALLGLSQGSCSPGMHSAWSKWAPPLERSFMVSFTLAGTNFGAMAIMPIAGTIADHLGWEAVFYFTGGIAAVFSIVFLSIVHNSPNEHPRISDEEKNYITKATGLNNQATSKKDHRVPWFKLFTSLPFWALLLATCASNWGDYVIIAMLPSYMTIVLGYNLSTMGVLASLPFMINFIVMIFSGYLTDVLRNKKVVTTTFIRKVNTTLGLVGPAIFLVLAVNVGCDVTAAVALFTISVGFAGFTAPGCKANSLDIAPQYDGITWGITVSLSNVFGLISIQVAGLMLDIDDSISQWRHVFWVAAIVYCIGAVIYLIFGSGILQPWARGVFEFGESMAEKQSDEAEPLQVS